MSAEGTLALMQRVVISVRRDEDPDGPDLAVPTDVPASELKRLLGDALGWPVDVLPLRRLRAEPPGRLLDDHETLAAAEVWDGAWLVLADPNAPPPAPPREPGLVGPLPSRPRMELPPPLPEHRRGLAWPGSVAWPTGLVGMLALAIGAVVLGVAVAFAAAAWLVRRPSQVPVAAAPPAVATRAPTARPPLAPTAVPTPAALAVATTLAPTVPPPPAAPPAATVAPTVAQRPAAAAPADTPPLAPTHDASASTPVVTHPVARTVAAPTPGPTLAMPMDAPTLAPPTAESTLAAPADAPISTAPTDPDALWPLTLGEVQAHWGTDWLGVVDRLQAFHDQFPNYAPASDLLYTALLEAGRAAASSGDRDQALAAYERAAALNPARPEAPAMRAALLAPPAPPAASAPASPPTPTTPLVPALGSAPAPTIPDAPAATPPGSTAAIAPSPPAEPTPGESDPEPPQPPKLRVTRDGFAPPADDGG